MASEDRQENQQLDLLWGLVATARFLKSTPRQVQYQAEKGLLPVKMQGRLLVARKSALERHFGVVEADVSPTEHHRISAVAREPTPERVEMAMPARGVVGRAALASLHPAQHPHWRQSFPQPPRSPRRHCSRSRNRRLRMTGRRPASWPALSLSPSTRLRSPASCCGFSRLAEPARIEKPERRDLGRHVVELCRSRTGLESLPDAGARVAGERGDDRSLAGTGLSQQPHDERVPLGTLARVLRACGARSANVAEQRLIDGLPQPVEKVPQFPSNGPRHRTVEPPHQVNAPRCAIDRTNIGQY